MTNDLLFYFTTNTQWKISELSSHNTPSQRWPTLVNPYLEEVDQSVENIEAEESRDAENGQSGKTMDTTERTGTQNLTLDTNGLFDDLDFLQKSFEDVEDFNQTSTEGNKCPLDLLDDINSESKGCPKDLKQTSMDNPLFEEFQDLDQLFPELASVDLLNLGFEVEQAWPAPSDICHSDVVMWETDVTCKDAEAASPYSEVTDLDSFEKTPCLPSPSMSDVAQPPESIVDVLSVNSESISSESLTSIDSKQDTVSEEVTVIETSHPLTLLTQELTDSSSCPEVGEASSSALTVDVEELLSISASLGLTSCAISSWVSDHSEKKDDPSNNPTKDEAQPKRKKVGSSSDNSTLCKKAKYDSTLENSAYKELDKRTIRRLKNNIASKHSRASRKQKHLELFQKEVELQQDNARLHKQIKELQLLTSSLRKILVEKLSSATCPM